MPSAEVLPSMALVPARFQDSLSRVTRIWTRALWSPVNLERLPRITAKGSLGSASW